MSAPAKTTDQAIRQAARALFEKGGVDSLSMQAVADAVGIRAPSLYKRFHSRADLFSAAATDALEELASLLAAAVDRAQPYASLERMANVYRKYARKHPRVYALLFAEGMAPRDDLTAARNAAARDLLLLLTETIGSEDALNAARMLVSFLHGFVSMELAKAFRFGGNINQAFQFGLTKVLDSLFTPNNRAT